MSSKKHKKKAAAAAATGTRLDPPAREQSRAKQSKKPRTPVVENAPLPRRFFAYLIDWYVGALATCLPISLFASKLTGNMLNQNLIELPEPFGLIAGACALLCAFVYFVAIPAFVWPGQTPAKRMLGVKIVRTDGSPVDFGHLVLRQVVGLIVVDGTLVSASAVWHQMLSIATGINFVTPLMYVGFVLTLVNVLMIVLRQDRRCIHDFIGDTRVVKAPRPATTDSTTLD